MIKKLLTFVFVASLFLITNSAYAIVPPTDVYVDGSVAGPGTGTLLDPFKDIQTAIDDAGTGNGSTIHLADGTYTITTTLERFQKK